MSVQTRRTFFLVVALVVCSQTLLAKHPSARSHPRMVYDAQNSRTILFGGIGPFDAATRQAYDLNDTWAWSGERWTQLYPAHVPPGRSYHTMVYDSNRSRVILFGGKSGKDSLNDTWVFEKGDWRKLDTPDSPPARNYASAAFDPVRDRVVLFGGYYTTPDGKTTTKFYDTWEFDGTTWRKIADGTPVVLKPLLAYDAPRGQVLMLGINEKTETLMYAYDGTKWTELKPATLPACVNEGTLTVQSQTGSVVAVEGICSGSAATTETFEWTGETWNKLDLATKPDRVSGAALSYDASRRALFLFGGLDVFASPTTSMWARGEGGWSSVADNTTPAPRSLFAFRADPVSKAILLYGGITDTRSSLDDFWRYQNGQWQAISLENAPVACGTSQAVFDTDRKRMVVVCADATVAEWDGLVWKKFADLKTKPDARRLGSLAYDPVLKKSVFFGGWDDINYRDDTWLWDGTQWAQVAKKNHPFSRSNTVMWFDPVLKKVVLYGGIGRRSREDRIERFGDMWTFDGTNWTEVKPSATPGQRYGAQAVVDPRTNHVFLFGGLIVESAGVTQNQVYASDFWEWDGATWKKLTITGPPARENGAFEVDPSTGDLILYGGYAGYYLSDVWAFNGTQWRLVNDGPVPPQQRRRPAAVPRPSLPVAAAPVAID